MAIRTIAKRVFIVVHIGIATLFLCSCANAFLPPEKWWFFALLGLAFPFLLLLVIIFLLFWTLFRSRWAFLSLAVLLLGFTNIRALIGFHSGGFTPAKSEQSIRIMSWNVRWFDEQKRATKGAYPKRKQMLEFIKEQDADILCFQEYFESNRTNYSNLKDLQKMNYPYCYKVIDYGRKGGSIEVGVAIFSRFPITDSIRIRYPGPLKLRAAESLIACDIDVHGQKIRVFNTHLQSVLFQQQDYEHLRTIRSADDSILDASRSIVKKLKQGYTSRSKQVDIVREQLDKSPYPAVICGDFNDVPNSYTYFRIRGNRQDAFIASSNGIGRTFSNISPTLRIDYIMPDKQFEVLQFKRHVLPYSDHYPVVTDLRISTNE
ncbi:endonuclease/exonuclease/phosphatase family protein [Pseudoflavitalea sp. X16]|uniref:endonuclease/exonuclease/phosphatase family protein n=1 Tax=Paraflavitalea devenefica TaxID=2716334 RepID=UPI001423CC89|nr:endonuclease/exonuclease/phosphatase family protein [Paraflavitalea devenefica]NII24286.1 endonuclease/exonuclease/phosphatase family protein [Paraflavitalea devenefica]